MSNIVNEFLNLNNFQRAWQKVAENKGSAGVDGETIDNFAKNQAVNVYQLLQSVANGTYEVRPYKQVVVGKKNGGRRELKIPAVRDRIVQQALLNVINPVVDNKFSSASFAYRPNLSYLNAVKQIAEWRDLGFGWVLDGDIVKFFDNIEHQRLLQEVRNYIDNPGILCLIKSWVLSGILTDEGLVLPQKGIPQGAVISPLLANVYLDKFDKIFSQGELRLVRYADDFVILAKTKEEILHAKLSVSSFLNSIGLAIHEEKTQLTNFERGFRFLGHGFLGKTIFPVDVDEDELKSAIQNLQNNSGKNNSGKNKQVNGQTQQQLNQPNQVNQQKNIGKKKSQNITENSEYQNTWTAGEENKEIIFDLEFLSRPLSYQAVEVKSKSSNHHQYKQRNSQLNQQANQVQKEGVNLDLDNESLNAENTPFQKNIWHREMATIYLIEQGTSIYKDYQRFIIHVPDKPRLEVPVREVQQILVFGNIQLSTSVIQVCFQEKIAVIYMSQSGLYHGHLWSEELTNLDNQLMQIEKRGDNEFQVNVSRAVVLGKLMNSKQLLMRFNRKRKIQDVEKAIFGISQDIDSLNYVDNLDSLRGYEGMGAARYFPAFGKLITNSAFTFSQRFRQPPIDEVNSLLSFGYTLLFNNVLSFIIAEGLSPYIANFHYGDRQKPYLAFDLMEEFRSPVVDSLVLNIINHSLFKPQDFDVVASTGGVYLSQSARKVFLTQFETRMNEEVTHPDLISSATYRHAIQLQVRRYKRCLLSGVPYESFLRAG
jgi:CRISP-associated protein Cas1